MLYAMLQAADGPKMIEVGLLLRWLIVPGLVTALLAFMAVASFTAFMKRWSRNKENQAAEMWRSCLGAPHEADATASWLRGVLDHDRQGRHTASWVLDRLSERHDETRGLIARIFSPEMREMDTNHETVRQIGRRTDEHQESLVFIRKSLSLQAESLSILPQLEKTFTRVENTLHDVQKTMTAMTGELARMQGTIDAWDGNERRKHER